MHDIIVIDGMTSREAREREGETVCGDTGAFYFDSIRAEDAKLFLLKQTYNLKFEAI